MKNLRAVFVVFVVTVIAMANSGRGGSETGPLAKMPLDDQQATPFLSRGQYSDRMARAIDDSLRNHRFTLPWLAAKGPDRSVWFVAERFQAEHRFDRIYVRATSEANVTASMTAYQFQGSDWASLGKAFVGDACRLEAEAIAAEITRNLNEKKQK